MVLLQSHSLIDIIDTNMMISFIDSLVFYTTGKIMLYNPNLCDAVNWLLYLSTH